MLVTGFTVTDCSGATATGFGCGWLYCGLLCKTVVSWRWDWPLYKEILSGPAFWLTIVCLLRRASPKINKINWNISSTQNCYEKTYWFQHVASEMLPLLHRRMEHAYFRSQIQYDIDQNYRFHSKVLPVHNQRHPSRHKFGLLDRMPYHSDTENGNLVPEKKNSMLIHCVIWHFDRFRKKW